MMAVMVQGMPHVHSCHTTTGREVLWGGSVSEPRICPPIMTEVGSEISAVEERLDSSHWKRLPAIHCMATQSSLSFMCGLDGRTRKVRYEKFRQPCGIQPAACWKALENGKLEVGEKGVSRDNEPDKKSHGRGRRLLRKLQTAGQGPGKKNHTGTCGSSGGKRLDLVERRKGPSGH